MTSTIKKTARAGIYILLICLLTALTILHTHYPRFFKKIPYRIDAFFTANRIHCNTPSNELTKIISKISLPYFSLNSQIVYIDQQGVLNSCKVSPDGQEDFYLFRFASMTKVITTFAMLDIAHKQSIDLDTPLLDFFPEVDRNNLRDKKLIQVTLNHLLNHSSGFGGPWGSDNMVKKGEKPWCPYNVKQLENIRLAGRPGTNHLYSNVAYCLLGEVITRLTKTEYRQYIQEHYLSGYSSLRFADKYFLPTEPDYDFSNDYRTGPDYVEWMDFYAISSAAGLMGNPEEFAKVIWQINQQDTKRIFSGPPVIDCNKKNLKLCYSYTFTLKTTNGKNSIAVQQGYMPGASSIIAINQQGAVIVWTAAGAAMDSQHLDDVTDRIATFLISNRQNL